MAASADIFLQQFYMQMLFDEMALKYPSKLKTFKKYVENGDYKFRGDMEMWKDRLYHPNAAGDHVRGGADGVSGVWQMDDKAWKELYLEFRDALRDMDFRRSEFDGSKPGIKRAQDVIDFLEKYYSGADSTFNVSLSDKAKKKIEEFGDLIKNNAGLKAGLVDQLDAALEYWGIDTNCEELRKGIDGKKYESDIKFQAKLKKVLKTLETKTKQRSWSWDTDDSNIIDNLIRAGFRIDLKGITDDFDDAIIKDDDLNKFKNNYQAILELVAKNGQIKKHFKSEKISSALNFANEKLSYNNPNSENYLEDSKNDKKDIWKEIQDWGKDTYEDVFEKYKLLQGDRLYYSPQAKEIISALNGKAKPTDGLDGIVNAAGDVKEKLQKKSAAATKYYGWMVKTLGDIKKVMPESYKGALSNGTQLNHVVTELIKRAVQDSKNGDKHAIEAAKTAMEVISVSKYGLFTSKVMDALNAELKNFTFMSDPSLSWNSNPYTKAVSTAFDKGVSFLMRTIGYGATGLINAINRRNSRFDGERGGLSGLSAEWEKDNADGKKKYTDDIKKLNDEASDSITRLEGEIAATGVKDDADLDKTKKELAAGQKKEENIEIVLSRLQLELEQLAREVEDKGVEIQQKKEDCSYAQQNFDNADGIYKDKIQQKNHYDSVIDEYKNLPNTIKDKQSDIVAKRGYKKYLESKLETLKYPYKNAKEENEARQLQESLKRVDTEIEAYTKSLAELMEKYKNKDKPDSELQQANKGLKGIGKEIDTAQKNRDAADGALKTAEDKKTAAESELQKLEEKIKKIEERMEKISGRQSKQKTKNRDTESKIKTFQDAKKQIEELNKQIRERQKTADEWDDKHKNLYDELIAYWDMLETGRNGRRGAFYNRWTLSKKKAQGDLDANKKAMFEEFLKNYSYTS